MSQGGTSFRTCASPTALQAPTANMQIKTAAERHRLMFNTDSFLDATAKAAGEQPAATERTTWLPECVVCRPCDGTQGQPSSEKAYMVSHMRVFLFCGLWATSPSISYTVRREGGRQPHGIADVATNHRRSTPLQNRKPRNTQRIYQMNSLLQVNTILQSWQFAWLPQQTCLKVSLKHRAQVPRQHCTAASCMNAG